MDRRGFLGSILALAAAPAIVRADSLMRIVPRETTLITGEIGTMDRFVIVETGHTMMTIDQITREALRIAHDKATFIKHVRGNTFRVDDVTKFGGLRSGDTVRIRMPKPFIPRLS